MFYVHYTSDSVPFVSAKNCQRKTFLFAGVLARCMSTTLYSISACCIHILGIHSMCCAYWIIEKRRNDIISLDSSVHLSLLKCRHIQEMIYLLTQVQTSMLGLTKMRDLNQVHVFKSSYILLTQKFSNVIVFKSMRFWDDVGQHKLCKLNYIDCISVTLSFTATLPLFSQGPLIQFAQIEIFLRAR